jgi:cation:H+ antiporter
MGALPLALDLLLLLGGTVTLAYSGNRLVDSAAAIAEKARLTPAVIGLTVVAAGTSAPELIVSVTGALRRSPGIAIGNVVGSNIANIVLILGGCALITPIPVARGVCSLPSSPRCWGSYWGSGFGQRVGEHGAGPGGE